MKQPLILSMAIQEQGTNGKYTGFHWRIKFRDYFKSPTGKKWFIKEVIRPCDKDYLNEMLKEIPKCLE